MKNSKRILSATLVLAISVSSISVFAKENKLESGAENKLELRQKSEEKLIVDEILINYLEKNDISYSIDNNQVKIKDISKENLNYVNNVLKQEFQEQVNSSTELQRTTYPTAWVNLKETNIATSKKFKRATKEAFAVSVIALIGGFAGITTVTAKALGYTAATGFGQYYFVNSDEENVYYFSNQHYRMLGPHWTDSNGNVYGNYELKRRDRTTKSSNGSGGQLTEKVIKSTSVYYNRW